MCDLAPSNILGALRYAAGGWDAATVRACRPVRWSPHTGTSRTARATRPPGRRSWPTVWLTARRHHGPARHTQVTPLGMDTYGRGRCPSAASRCTSRWRRSRRRRAHRCARAGGVRGGPGVTDNAFRVKGAPDKARTIPNWRWSAWHAHDLPAGTGRTWMPRPSTTRQLHVAVGNAHMRHRGRHARPAPPTSCATSRSTTAARSSTR